MTTQSALPELEEGTGITLTRHPDAMPPSPEEIDGLVADYEYAQKIATGAKEDLDAAKERLIFFADNFGHRPAHAEQSIRLSGRHNTVTVTRGTTVTVNDRAVDDLQVFLSHNSLMSILPRLFGRQTKWVLIDGARDVLKTVSLPQRFENKLLSLFGRCIDVKTKSPSVKIEVIKPEKPAKARKGKAAA
jgi:hypothetical protein